MYRLLHALRPPGGDATAVGRALLAQALSPASLPDIHPGQHGKPGFAAGLSLWFNISHSGSDVILLLSDEGEVGCDIETVRPRKNWRHIAEAVFSAGEHRMLADADDKLTAFWQIWTRKEAMLKQAGGHIWQIADYDSATPAPLFLHQIMLPEKRVVTLCTPTVIAGDIFAR